MNELEREQIGRALGRVPSGCAILSAAQGTIRTGMLASWIQQISFEPPGVSVAVRKGRVIESVIDGSGAFVLNILGENPGAMFKHFGKGFGAGEDAFAGLKVRHVACGVVIEDRTAYLGARVRGKHDAGDHWVYFGEVVEGEVEGDGKPYVHVRKSGFSY